LTSLPAEAFFGPFSWMRSGMWGPGWGGWGAHGLAGAMRITATDGVIPIMVGAPLAWLGLPVLRLGLPPLGLSGPSRASRRDPA
jgi:hypothetical protein